MKCCAASDTVAFPSHTSYHQRSLVSTPVLLLGVHIFHGGAQREFLDAGISKVCLLDTSLQTRVPFPVGQIPFSPGPRSGVNYVLMQFDK